MTGEIVVERLRPNKVTHKVVGDLNDLLKKQHSEAMPVSREHLLERMREVVVVVAWNHNERVVGMGVLIIVAGLNFTCGDIRHFVINDGLNILSVGMRIVQELMNFHLHGIAYYEGGVWVQDEEMKRIFTALGFEEKPQSRYRLRVPKVL